MGSVDFGTTPSQNITVLRRVAQQIIDDLYDNGTPGLITRVEAHMSEAIGADAEQARQHRSNSTKLNIIIAFAALVTLIVTIVGIVISAKMH